MSVSGSVGSLSCFTRAANDRLCPPTVLTLPPACPPHSSTPGAVGVSLGSPWPGLGGSVPGRVALSYFLRPPSAIFLFCLNQPLSLLSVTTSKRCRWVAPFPSQGD